MNYNQVIETINRLKDKQFKHANVDEVYADLENLDRFIKELKNEIKVYDKALASMCSDEERWKKLALQEARKELENEKL